MPCNILGISAFYHDSAACIVQDGKIIAAAQEERFTRKKHDASFPSHAIRYCLEAASIVPDQIDFVVFYDKPLLKFERILETCLAFAPRGVRSFVRSMPVWVKEKLFMPTLLPRQLNEAFGLSGKQRIEWQKKLLFTEHHQSHAASAFFPSPFHEAAILTMDGVGEWATSSLARGDGNRIEILYEQHFPHSAGLLYTAFTYYTGFKVNSGEYKVMGLAPYGEPKYVRTIYDNLIHLKEDGSFRLNLDFFNFCTGLTMTNERFHTLFGAPPRKPESPITQREMDLARSIQVVTEEIVLKTARFLKKETGMENLCLAGGVALNCVANGKILKENIFKNVWGQPAAGDAGGALGAALAVWYQFLGKNRVASAGQQDEMSGGLLGPSFSNNEIEAWLVKEKIPFKKMTETELIEKTSTLLQEGNIVGWFQGRMEFGPRALGGRSILGDPRNAEMQSILNLKIKFRESFRPFAPSVLRERVSDYFELNADSPYMMLVAPVKREKRKPLREEELQHWGIEKLKTIRSEIPAVTHVDYSARIQTIHRETNPRFHALAENFGKKTGVPVLINTSFNVRGEPIVCTPQDAFRCFLRTEMDCLVLENFLLDRTEQKIRTEKQNWKNEFPAD